MGWAAEFVLYLTDIQNIKVSFRVDDHESQRKRSTRKNWKSYLVELTPYSFGLSLLIDLFLGFVSK